MGFRTNEDGPLQPSPSPIHEFLAKKTLEKKKNKVAKDAPFVGKAIPSFSIVDGEFEARGVDRGYADEGRKDATSKTLMMFMQELQKTM